MKNLNDLVTVANTLDKKGLIKESDLLDSIITKLAAGGTGWVEMKKRLAEGAAEVAPVTEIPFASLTPEQQADILAGAPKPPPAATSERDSVSIEPILDKLTSNLTPKELEEDEEFQKARPALIFLELNREIDTRRYPHFAQNAIIHEFPELNQRSFRHVIERRLNIFNRLEQRKKDRFLLEAKRQAAEMIRRLENINGPITIKSIEEENYRMLKEQLERQRRREEAESRLERRRNFVLSRLPKGVAEEMEKNLENKTTIQIAQIINPIFNSLNDFDKVIFDKVNDIPDDELPPDPDDPFVDPNAQVNASLIQEMSKGIEHVDSQLAEEITIEDLKKLLNEFKESEIVKRIEYNLAINKDLSSEEKIEEAVRKKLSAANKVGRWYAMENGAYADAYRKYNTGSGMKYWEKMINV
jgi:hypothetical protein